MNFSKGQLLFAAFFVLAFAIGMLLAYRKDANINKLYYKNVYLILVGIVVVFVVLWMIVKLKSSYF